jgi:hypothetical protein
LDNEGGIEVSPSDAPQGHLERLLKESRPFVQKLGPQEGFGPDYFIKHFGQQDCLVSRGDQTESTTVGSFFQSMKTSKTGRKIKVGKYPIIFL